MAAERPAERPNSAEPRKRGRLSLKPKILELGKWTRDNDREARQSKKAGNWTSRGARGLYADTRRTRADSQAPRAQGKPSTGPADQTPAEPIESCSNRAGSPKSRNLDGYSARKVFTCPHELAAEVDRYRRAQPEIPSESRAFAELIKLGLERWRKSSSASTRKDEAIVQRVRVVAGRRL
jgi:hypothetical protein